GDDVEVLYVKGSGGDMATVEPPGMTAVRLDRLRKLRARPGLSEDDAWRMRRECMLDPTAPYPSVEMLLHAFLPHKFVDHTHANAVLSLIDQPDGDAICYDVYGSRAGTVPYFMPGFALAQHAANIHDIQPKVEALILHKHGIVTFGASAREAYERMIEMVTLAEERLQRDRKSVFVSAQVPERSVSLVEFAPALRGACSQKDDRAEGAWRRLILDFRSSPAILNYVNGAEISRYSQAGVVTPDHTIRTKNWPLIVAAPEEGKAFEFKRAVQKAVAAFVDGYKAYFARNNERVGHTRKML